MKIRLSEEDATRYGVERDIEVDESKFMAREVIVMQKVTGWTVDKLGRALQGKVALDDDGKPLYLRDGEGNEVHDESGKRIPLREVDVEALLILAWMGVRRLNPEVKYVDFDIDLTGVNFGGDEDIEGDEGKA